MKRLLLLLLLLALLCGCQEEPPKPQTTPVEKPPAATGTSLYLPELSPDEKGNVRAYRMEEAVEQILPLGQDVLVITQDGENYRLRILSGDSGVVRREKLLESGAMTTGGFWLGQNALCYFNAVEQVLVKLDPELMEIGRLPLQEAHLWDPLVSRDLTRLYYCVEDEIRVLNLETGVSQLLKQHTCQSQSLLGFAGEGQILLCRVTGEDGERIVFVSTADGQTLGQDDALEAFYSGEETWFLRRRDGISTEYLAGDFAGNLHALTLDPAGKQFLLCREENALVAVTPGVEETLVEAYSLQTGLCYARVGLRGIDGVSAVAAGEQGIWLSATQGQQPLLCLWNWKADPAADTASILATRYTAAQPDTKALEALQTRADGVAARYGVKITLDPSRIPQPEDYTLTGEHQPQALEQALTQLENTLAMFPQGFFPEIVEDTASEVLEISLVRSVSHDQNALQYWLGANAYIALPLGEDLEGRFYQELCHVLDNYIYANTRDMDVWDKLNPEGFRYDNSYLLYHTHGEEYLTGADRAFVDAFSRTYPKEDRAAIFRCAMMPGNEEVFAPETMQKKLRLLCFSIRSAFDWEKEEATFPWEQYLQEPLAYTKKK